jgi:hypothetical protein
MTAERQFEATAQCRTVDRGDDRFGERLDGSDKIAQHWRLWRLAKFTDIGAGGEGPAGASQDDGFDRGVGSNRLNGIEQRLPHRVRQRIHRRIVDGDDGDAIVARDQYG